MIDKIGNQIFIEKGRPQKKYEVIIKDIESGEIMYQHKSFGGLVCTIEKVNSFSKGSVEASHQLVAWGNPLLSVYSLERLTELVTGEEIGNAVIDSLLAHHKERYLK